MMHLQKEHLKKNQSKLKRYPTIVKNLAKAYKIKFKVEKKKIRARRKKKPMMMHEYLVCKILTNNSAREKAKQDLKVLEAVGNKKVVGKEFKDSLRRLNIISKSHGEDMVREIKYKN